ncbi:MAG: carbohydrate deacetylase, partial [Myxococcaceae bacterium]
EKVRWLAPGGRFRGSWAELAGAFGAGMVPEEEVALEFRAQLSRARGLGARVDHLDAHQHLHLLPGLAGLVLRLAREEALPVRWPSETPRLSWLAHPGAAAKSALLLALSRVGSDEGVRKVPAVGIFEAGSLDETRLAGLLEGLGPGDYELGCHPGRDPGTVAEDPSWRYGWETELSALCGERARALVERRGIVLTTYGGLAP